MHPSMRIIACIISIIFISQASWLALAQYALLLFLLIIFLCRPAVGQAIRMTWRLKWLLVSIVIASAWFIPGEPLIQAMGSWSPAYEGSLFGVQRAVALIEIIFLVMVLVETTVSNRLIQGLQWCLLPLSAFGISVNKLSLRITLVLEEVRNPSIDLKKQLELNKHEKRFDRLVLTVASIYQQITSPVESHKAESITLEPLQRPSITQWLILFVIVLGLYIPSRWL